MSAARFDAIVIGGGPAGATAAILLAGAGWSVALVEKARFPRRKVCGEFISASNAELLSDLGVADTFRELAGPEVRRVGLYNGDTRLTAPMPKTRAVGSWFGRALGRETLDALLLERAAAVGARVRQPAAAVGLVTADGRHTCTILAEGCPASTLEAPVVIAAHGSWERGGLPTQIGIPHTGSCLLAFKAHFRDANLPPDLMPLLAFPGGYGGMVQTDAGRVSLSCCIRRDRLSDIRRLYPGRSAGQAVQAHIAESCHGVRKALAAATLDGAWLAAGPIHPGIRTRATGGIFTVGNAAGEAHPIVAEGISMAMQSSFMLARSFIAHQDVIAREGALQEIGHGYSHEWRSRFSTRIHAAALFAGLAMRPAAATVLRPMLTRFPQILTLGAALSGKTKFLATGERDGPEPFRSLAQ